MVKGKEIYRFENEYKYRINIGDSMIIDDIIIGEAYVCTKVFNLNPQGTNKIIDKLRKIIKENKINKKCELLVYQIKVHPILNYGGSDFVIYVKPKTEIF